MFGNYTTRDLTSHKFSTDEHHRRAIKAVRKSLHIAVTKCKDIDVLDKALNVITDTHEPQSGRVAEK